MELPDSRAFNQREVSARRAIDTQGLATIHPRPHHVGSGGNRRVRFRPQISHQPTPVDEMHEDRAHVPGIVRLPQTALQRRVRRAPRLPGRPSWWLNRFPTSPDLAASPRTTAHARARNAPTADDPAARQGPPQPPHHPTVNSHLIVVAHTHFCASTARKSGSTFGHIDRLSSPRPHTPASGMPTPHSPDLYARETAPVRPDPPHEAAGTSAAPRAATSRSARRSAEEAGRTRRELPDRQPPVALPLDQRVETKPSAASPGSGVSSCAISSNT